MKEITTIMAAVTAMALIGFGMYGFVNGIDMWGAPVIAGMFAGGVTLAVAHNL
jgi:hypothetical protein